MWRRLREEAPLYHNGEYDFWALSRFEDVEKGLVDWRTYSSAKGTLLELIKANVEIPKGSMIFEDPPDHEMYRGLLSRVFTPRKMNAIEPKVRAFCARSLDPLVERRVRLHRRPRRPDADADDRHALGIPEQDQEAIRDRIDDGLRLEEGSMEAAASRYGRPSTSRACSRTTSPGGPTTPPTTS